MIEEINGELIINGLPESEWSKLTNQEKFDNRVEWVSPDGNEVAVLCHPKDGYKVRIEVWERSHGFINKPRANNQNPAHAIILLPTLKKSTPKDVIAKLNITSKKAPKTMDELNERLFDIDTKRLTQEIRKSILKWCNDKHITIDNTQYHNWSFVRSMWICEHEREP